MIVADTSALISLATAEVLELVLDEFDVYTTATVIEEVGETAEYDDTSGKAAQNVLDQQTRLTVENIDPPEIKSSRVDRGEASCLALIEDIEAAFLITDDLRALPELQPLTDAQVAISPIVLKALVQRDVLEQGEALERLEQLAEQRSWLGAPIYRRARDLF